MKENLRRVGALIQKHQQALILLVMIAVFASVTVQQRHQAAVDRRADRDRAAAAVHRAEVDSYERCWNRYPNVQRANAFYQKMAKIEAANPYVSATIRAQRVYLYSHQVLALPDCGKKP